jgi:hypothetical protein
MRHKLRNKDKLLFWQLGSGQNYFLNVYMQEKGTEQLEAAQIRFL